MNKIKNWWNNRSETTKSAICLASGFALGFGLPAILFGVGGDSTEE